MTLEVKKERKYWLALALNYKIGSRTFIKIQKNYGLVSKIWLKKEADLINKGFNQGQINEIINTVKNTDFNKNDDLLKKYNIEYVTLIDKEYPEILKEIPDPPGVLFYKGDMKLFKTYCLAVVGSRSYSKYGEMVNRKIVDILAKSGITIVSGLALGIDTLAHESALDMGGKTIAVLGNGLDTIYPTTNIRLADKIIQNNGLIITEYPVGIPAFKSNFPLRNRIIAGLSLGTLVIEAAEDSGSLITARASIEYNREVFAVPGSIFNDQSKGPNKLIKMGARLVESAEDILVELNLGNMKNSQIVQEIIPDNEDEAKVLNILEKPIAVDSIIKETKLAPTLVNTTLIMLEMKGKIRNLGGTIYVLNGKLKKL